MFEIAKSFCFQTVHKSTLRPRLMKTKSQVSSLRIDALRNKLLRTMLFILSPWDFLLDWGFLPSVSHKYLKYGRNWEKRKMTMRVMTQKDRLLVQLNELRPVISHFFECANLLYHKKMQRQKRQTERETESYKCSHFSFESKIGCW